MEIKKDFKNEKRTILIVDDEEINREILTNILEEDFDIITAENGQEGLDIIRSGKKSISLVVLDLFMPVLDGIGFLQARKEDMELSSIPVIVITADVKSEETCLLLGAIDFISKPFQNPKAILARAKRTIELFEDRKILKYTEKDDLTGLYNPDFFYEYIIELDERHNETKMDAVIIDIVNFHIINDRFGMKYGDELLKKAAENIQKEVSKVGGIACHKEADTFLVYCTHQDNYQKFYDKITFDPNVRFRIGIYENVDKSVDAIMRYDRAHLAANLIRHTLNKNIETYDESLHQKELFEQQLVDDFNHAIENKEFTIFYQPKFNITGDKPYLYSAEALVRWIHPKIGFISPNAFIPLFERNGLIERLDAYVWETVARQIKEWKEKLGFYVPISVNVSRIDMYNPNLINVFNSIIENNGLGASDINLEITESAYTNDSLQIIKLVSNLRDLGFKIEMDDFGTGYSSLNMINELPIDVLKLDMAFIRKAYNETKDTKIVEVILDIAKYLKVPVVAEGVETKEQLESLKELGCDMVQGYYFSKPIPEADFEKFLIERKEQLK